MQRWFLSYHSPDQALAERLKAAIERKDATSHVFFAPTHMRAGGSWTAQLAQETHEDEIVANLAGGRAIVHVAKDAIVFAAIDQPVERNSIPPRVMDLDATHIGVLFGASEWRIPADPKPIRLDRNFQRVARGDPRYQSAPGEGETDLETMGIAFLEKLRPLVAQLHHKLEFSSDDPIFQIVIIGYAPNDYGPEVWVVEYRIEQEQDNYGKAQLG